MEKERRHRKLLNLIAARRIGTQGELAAHLERAGFAVTQSSVSRDLEELGVVKRRGAYALPAPAADGRPAVRGGPLSLEVAGDAQMLGAALNHSALNAANALGAWLGGLVIAAGWGYRAPSGVGVGLAAVGLVFLAGSAALRRREQGV